MGEFEKKEKLKNVNQKNDVVIQYSSLEDCINELEKLEEKINYDSHKIPEKRGSGYYTETIYSFTKSLSSTKKSFSKLLNSTIDYLRTFEKESKEFDKSKSSSIKKK